jgi:hypothetical protein
MNPSKSLLLACALAFCATQAFAGPLAVDGTSIAGFHGTTPYQGFDLSNNPTGLSGTIDYAVWAPGTFPGAFAGFSASDYVYTYQAHETGPAFLSSFSVALNGPTDTLNIGDFTGNNGPGLVAGQASNSAFIIDLDSANWSFDGIAPGGSSDGLAFSSPNGPIMSTGSTIDDGSVAFVIPVPGPVANVPEPGALTLASCGVVVFVLQWLRRRERKTIHL